MVIADLALYSRDGRLIALVEVKNLRGTSREWAAKFRRNLLEHGSLQGARFFILATVDHLYLWEGEQRSASPVPPTYEVDLEPLLAPYFERSGLSPQTIHGQTLELIVADWLNDLMRSQGGTADSKAEDWLVRSGLLASVRDGRLDYQDAA